MRKIVMMLGLVALAGCDVPAGGTLTGTEPTRTEPVSFTPFTWKANTPRGVRAYDINECELAGRGLPPDASPDQIAAASSVSNPQDVARFVNRCLSNKGYTVTQKPVCQDVDYTQGQLMQGLDVLPPLERIRCLDPVAKGMIVTA